MFSVKDVALIADKITRRFEIELPLEIVDFTLEDEILCICFQKGEVAKSFEVTKDITLEFDNNSRIIGLKIKSASDYLPKPISEPNEV